MSWTVELFLYLKKTTHLVVISHMFSTALWMQLEHICHLSPLKAWAAHRYWLYGQAAQGCMYYLKPTSVPDTAAFSAGVHLPLGLFCSTSAKISYWKWNSCYVYDCSVLLALETSLQPTEFAENKAKSCQGFCDVLSMVSREYTQQCL